MMKHTPNSMSGYGFIAHDNVLLWFKGPLPSPKVARMLVMLNQGIDDVKISSEQKLALLKRWDLTGRPENLSDVNWVIDLESPFQRWDYVKRTLDELQASGAQVYHDAGPYFPENPIDNWTGEECPSP